MGRKPVLTFEQQASIQAMRTQGRGAKSIARIAGIGLSMVKRIFRKWRTAKALPGSPPQLALPVEQPRKPGVLPAPGRRAQSLTHARIAASAALL